MSEAKCGGTDPDIVEPVIGTCLPESWPLLILARLSSCAMSDMIPLHGAGQVTDVVWAGAAGPTCQRHPLRRAILCTEWTSIKLGKRGHLCWSDWRPG